MQFPDVRLVLAQAFAVGANHNDSSGECDERETKFKRRTEAGDRRV